MPPTAPRPGPAASDCSLKFIVPALVDACDWADPPSDDGILPRLVLDALEKVEPPLGPEVPGLPAPTLPP